MKKQLTIIACGLLLISNAGCARRANEETRGGGALADSAQPIRVSAENADAAEPAIAAGGDGATYVAWVEHGANKEADVFVVRLDKEGRAAGAPVRVNPFAGAAKAWRGDPPTVAVAPDKTLYVCWTARVAGETTGTNLYLSASRDEGRTFAAPVKVNDDEKPASHGMHSLAVAADNRVYVAWLDGRNVVHPPAPMSNMNGKPMEHTESNSEAFFAFSADGGRTFSANKRLAGEVCPCCKTALVAGANNQLYVGWRQVLPGDFRHIAVVSSSDGGQTFAAPQIVSDDNWKITGCPVSGPALAVANDGALRVVWYTAGERGLAGLYWTESRDHGQTFNERRMLADGQVRGNPALLADARNNLLAVWENDEEKEPRIFSARLSTDGTATLPAPLAASAELPSVATAGEQLFVGYIVSGKDQRSIWITRARPAA